MMLEAGQPDAADPFAHGLVAALPRHVLLAQAEGDVVGDRQPREQGIGLEHHAAVGAGLAHRHAVQGDAAGGRPVEPGDEAQQRRLAAARRPEHGDEVVVGDLEADRLERTRQLSTPHAEKHPRDSVDHEPAHARLQGNSRWFPHLNRKSEISPITPITMMPKMICPVASSAWLSMIMWPMPEDEPISSATMT